SSGRFSFVSPKSPESQSQAKPSLNGIHKGGRKRHFRYERPTSRIRCISARAPEERLIGRHNPRGKAHFAGAVGKNTVRADGVVGPGGLNPPTSRLWTACRDPWQAFSHSPRANRARR